MTSGEMVLRVFVAHAFNPPSAVYTLEEYRAGVQALLRDAAQVVSQLDAVARLGYSSIRLVPTFENSGYDTPLSHQTIISIANCDVAIVDLTDTSPNVMYELGYLDSSNTPATLIACEATSTPIPVDIADRFVARYKTPDRISESASATFVGCVEKSLRRQRISPSNRELAWFPSELQGIHLVGALSPDDLYSAVPTYPNFVYLEQYSDKDAILELMILLSRTYTARVHKYTSGDFPARQLLRDNLVVVGGPGVEGVNQGNPICRQMFERIGTRITYAADGESVSVRTDGPLSPTVLRPKYTTGATSNLVIDYGYFARFPNPFAPDANVILVNGLHTAGGLGSALAFSDRPQAAQNFRVVRGCLSSDEPAAFECIFEVETLSGDVLVPRIDPEWVFPISSDFL